MNARFANADHARHSPGIRGWLLSLSVLGLGLAVFLITLNEAQAYSDGIITMDSGEPSCGGVGASHHSLVYYNHSGSPHYFAVTDVNHRGKRPDYSAWELEQWRHQETRYREWTGSAWSTVLTKGTSSWRTNGSGCLNLSGWHYFTDDVILDNGALVKQRIRYHARVIIGASVLEWDGPWHDHFLQDP